MTIVTAHGAVLRVARPGEVRTYLVDPQFPKRADAKNAVCLVALAAGVGAYVRAVADVLEAKVSTETKALVFDSILPLLTTEYAKFWPNKSPEMFEFTRDRDGMTIHMELHHEVMLKNCVHVSVRMRLDPQAKRAARRA